MKREPMPQMLEKGKQALLFEKSSKNFRPLEAVSTESRVG
jgi:hypothetical protein